MPNASLLSAPMRWGVALFLLVLCAANADAQLSGQIAFPSGGVSSADYLNVLGPNGIVTQRATHTFPVAPYPPPPRPVVSPQLPPPIAQPVAPGPPFGLPPSPSPEGSISPSSASAENPLPNRQSLPPSTQPTVEPAQEPSIRSQSSSPPDFAPMAASPGSATTPWFGPNQLPFASPSDGPIRPQAELNLPIAPVPQEQSLPQALIRPAPEPTQGSLNTSTQRTAWLSWLNPTPKTPDYLVGSEMLSFRRGNDSGGAISTGDGFDRFGRSVAGRYTLAKLDGELSRKEFVFTGPFEWDRSKAITGPVSSSLVSLVSPSNSFGAVNGSDTHDQFHAVRFSSYELNHRSTGDGFSSIHGGVRIIDYREDYRLEAVQGASTGTFQLSTDNLLFGGQLGFHVAKPWSQRIHVGFGGSAGVFGNVADGTYQLRNNATTLAKKSDDDFRMVLLLQPAAKLNYRLTEHSQILCGYECMYFSGLATASDQRLGDPLAATPWFLRTTNDTLLYGWSVGFDARF